MKPKIVISIVLAMAAVITGGMLLLANLTSGSPGSPASTTAATPDAEQAAVEACQRSIVQRAKDHPVLGDRSIPLTWESNTADHPAPGRYDITGFLSAGEDGTYWRFSYSCQMVAEQSGDGSGRWVAADNTFEQVSA